MQDVSDRKLKVVFMGTPEFAVPSLDRIIEEGYDVPLVVTVPDRRQGRGRKLQPSAVKMRGLELGLRVITPEKLRSEELSREIAEVEPDVICVVAFRILPELIFSIPRLGSFNLHGSLLPAYRGAAPINRAIMAGEEVTGVTTFFLRKKVDTGDIILQRPIPIGPDMTAGELHDQMAQVGAEAVVDTLDMIRRGEVNQRVQRDEEATPAPKIFADDSLIDWGVDSRTLHNQVRGLSPYPGAFTFWKGKRFKVLRTGMTTDAASGEPGRVSEVEGRLFVDTVDRKVELLEVQLEGKSVRSVAEFLRGHHEIVGDVLGTPGGEGIS